MYYVKETKPRIILNCIGYITCKMTRYTSKANKTSYTFLRDVLNLKPYQRITERAEYELIKYAKDEKISKVRFSIL